ncbi:MAG TPA: glycosyltransferase family 1 protein, partial [Thermoanaerobaculia bacterium]|nr:glycosyltransferase family 1 protein [Thermoanaerobaculia bacterium]
MASDLSLAINGWRMHGLRTGVWRYLHNVVRHWTSEAAADFEAIRIYTPQPLDRDVDLPSNIETVVLRSRLPMIPWENMRLGPMARERVLFGPSHSIPLRPHDRTVVVIHDALLRLHPERFPWQARLFHDHLYEWSGRNATLVITDSEAAARDIENVYGVSREKIRVVHLAPDEMFRGSAQPRRDSPGTFTNLPQPYFLFVGKLSGRRDIPTLIVAFGEFLRRCSAPHHLVLAGKNVHSIDLQDLMEQEGVTERVLLVESASDLELRELYSSAELFVSPAVYETVSLPVLEAQAMG